MNSVCTHSPFQCIQISYRKFNRCITNFNHLTTIDDIIHLFLNDFPENEILSINDCCVYLDKSPYLLPLKSTDFLSDIVSHYSLSTIRLKLTVKRSSSPLRFAQRKKLIQSSTIIDPYEQIRLQEVLIQKQQEVIHQLTKLDINKQSIPKTTSQVRFRLSTTTTNQKHDVPSKPISEVKSILKKSSSIDRDIDQLIALKVDEEDFYSSDDDDDNQSTADSCLGSLSSVDSGFYSLTRQQLETLV